MLALIKILHRLLIAQTNTPKMNLIADIDNVLPGWSFGVSALHLDHLSLSLLLVWIEVLACYLLVYVH